MKPTALVTGANGYTGSHLCRFLAEKGVPTRGMYWAPDGEPDFSHENLELVPGDLRDPDGLKRALDGIKVVYNIAALYRVTNVPNEAFWETNVEGVGNIVRLAAEGGVERFVHCSTVGVYGDVKNPPADEDTPPAPADYYQYSKLRGEELALDLARRFDMPISVVRPAGIYGPLETRFLPIARLLQRKRFVMFGKGEVFYHFIHISDLCEAFVLCAERPEAVGRVYNVADARPIPLKEVVAVMCDALEIPTPKLRLPLFVLNGAAVLCEAACKPLGIAAPLHRRRAAWFNHTRAFDASRIQAELGFEPRVRPEDGLREMVRSYREASWLD